jgi:hypothetical protein
VNVLNAVQGLRLGEILWNNLSNSRDMRLGACNVRNPYGTEPFRTVARELAVHGIAFVGVQIKWDKGGTQSEQDYILSTEREMKMIKEYQDLHISGNHMSS